MNNSQFQNMITPYFNYNNGYNNQSTSFQNNSYKDTTNGNSVNNYYSNQNDKSFNYWYIKLNFLTKIILLKTKQIYKN
jgi:hypothetical protein